MDKETFRKQVEVALTHVRDIVRLRVMDLNSMLVPSPDHRQDGWTLSRSLLEAINDLQPSEEIEDYWPRRRYKLLTLRYVNGLSPEQVADRLHISRRHFYRQLGRALDEFSQYLWEVAVEQNKQPYKEDVVDSTPEANDEMQTLLREAAPLLRDERRCQLEQVLDDTLQLLAPVLEQENVDVRCALLSSPPAVSINAEILKQCLLGLLMGMINAGNSRAIRIKVPQTREETITLTIRSWYTSREGREAFNPERDLLNRRSVRLAAFQGLEVEVAKLESQCVECSIVLPLVEKKTVLLVDDNEDVLELFRRYLTAGGFQTRLAQTGAQAMSVAKTENLYAIILDLMMRDEDGWDILQTLRNHPQASGIPIIVCSVLDQEELATMLGAKAFLKKPVMRETLLTALAELDPPS